VHNCAPYPLYHWGPKGVLGSEVSTIMRRIGRRYGQITLMLAVRGHTDK
jgi:hypothetical protein